MNEKVVQDLAQRFVAKEIDTNAFLQSLQSAMARELTDTTLDIDRERRCGYPEVIFGERKTVASLIGIFECQLESGQPVLATRVSTEKAEPLLNRFANGSYNERARTFRIGENQPEQSAGRVSIVTAGTSDLAVAEEARETVEWMGIPCELIQDVGVAGPHRLPKHVDRLRESAVVVVAAGMEGALPSVVGGYVACPVIAVPTSVGYGAAFGGVAALLGMLNSCAANVTVVNIDAGFKAGYLAGLIAGRSRSKN